MTDPMKSDLGADPKRIKSDMRMIRRAVNNGWNTPPEIKQGIIKNLRSVVEGGKDLDIPSLLRIAETICKLDKSDMDALRLMLEAEKNEQPTEMRVRIVYGDEE